MWGILCVKEMCDNAKNENNDEEAEIIFMTMRLSLGQPVPRLFVAITAFETVRTFYIHTHEITEKVVNLENFLFS